MSPHASCVGLAPDVATTVRRPSWPTNYFTSNTYNLSPLFSTLTRQSRLTILFSCTYQKKKKSETGNAAPSPHQRAKDASPRRQPGEEIAYRSAAPAGGERSAPQRCKIGPKATRKLYALTIFAGNCFVFNGLQPELKVQMPENTPFTPKRGVGGWGNYIANSPLRGRKALATGNQPQTEMQPPQGAKEPHR